MAITAKQMVTALKEALAQNIGVRSVVVDGQTIQFDSRSEMREELEFWERKVKAEAGTRKLFRGVDLSGL
jgi:hypothetical protein